MKKRIVVTGMGILSSIGNTVDSFAESLLNGVSGVQNIPGERFSTQSKVYRNDKACILDQSLYEDLLREDHTVLRAASIRAIEQAILASGLDLDNLDHRDIGLCVGTSVGSNFPFMKWVNNYLKDESTLQTLVTTPTITGAIAKRWNILGPVNTISTACAAGTNSIGRACDYLHSGRARYVIAGGVDVFTDHSFSGFNSLQAITKGRCKPFDKTRDGLVLGDSAAFFILEDLEDARARNAPMYAEILGYSTLNEAYHPTAPNPDGSMAYRVMMEAVQYSGIQATDVEYINAHGTATKANDEMEYKAIKRFCGGNKVYVSSTKSMTGHTLGAAGSVELLATIVGMNKGFIPPTINMTDPMSQPGDENLVFVSEKGALQEYSMAISNSFGFAGNMASIVVKKI